ncbi:MAG: MFS transporter [Candidatus Sumerlaeaceae bacterium]
MQKSSSSQPTLAELFRNGNFVKFWVGQVISYLGDRVDQMAMIAVVSAGVKGAIAADRANMITFWATLPYVFMSFIAGPVVDRFDRRRLMIALDIFRALVVVALPFTISPEHDVRVIYALVLLIGCATAIFAPAKSAFLPEIVSERQLLRANSVTATMGTLTTLFGTMIGGALVSGLSRLNDIAHHTIPALSVIKMPLGIAAAFVIDSASYLVSALLLWLIVVQAQERDQVAKRQSAFRSEDGFLRRAFDGVIFLARHRVPAVAAFMVSWFFFIGGGYFTLTTKLTYLRLVKSEANATLQLGLAYGVLGLGLAIGGILAGRVAAHLHLRYFLPACFVTAAALMLLNLLPLPPATLYWVNLAIGLAAGGVVVSTETVMQRAVPDQMRGRVFAFNNLVLNILLLSSILAGSTILKEGGELAARFGGDEQRLAQLALILSGLAMIGAGVGAIGFPRGLSIATVRQTDASQAD